ncbi:hypothetical protein CHCC20333_3495 [Bacillus paralicheniformis]|uniref:hypothetical protein n=1 Tax=Bacillus paralicheniformis TaxID=1648923 RepID=UPI0011BE35C8|nr:hypothetical protein [Bacillus paralicheniformis]TWK86636.1 hypothetical protein CHCC20333_3495 [Bacillus paralicheniformis]
MRGNQQINRIAALITEIWEQQHGKSFLQLIEALKSDFIMQKTGSMEKEVFAKDDEFERFLTEHLNELIGDNQHD